MELKMTTFSDVSYDDFRKAASEFFTLTQDRKAVSHEQAENGQKTLTLLYLGGTNDWTDQQINSAVLIIEMATKRCFEVFMANNSTETAVNL